MTKRHCLSHAAGGASCAAWQFRPRGTHRVWLFSLDFLWFFLVSRQERTLNMLFTTISDLLFGSLADVVFLKSFFYISQPVPAEQISFIPFYLFTSREISSLAMQRI